jgi:hypothetical protein
VALVPALLEERKAELANPRFTMAQLLEENQLTKLSITTVCIQVDGLPWIQVQITPKYYVNGHEKPENKEIQKDNGEQIFEK